MPEFPEGVGGLPAMLLRLGAAALPGGILGTGAILQARITCSFGLLLQAVAVTFNALLVLAVQLAKGCEGLAVVDDAGAAALVLPCRGRPLRLAPVWAPA